MTQIEINGENDMHGETNDLAAFVFVWTQRNLLSQTARNSEPDLSHGNIFDVKYFERFALFSG